MTKPRMLFVRSYHGLLGGHLKVFDYMGHVAASGHLRPLLYLTPDSIAPPAELLPPNVEVVSCLDDTESYFLAGYNWQILDEAQVTIGDRPVVNLIQGLRHALADDPRRAYLERPALRICVSPAVETAIRETTRVNGPVVTIPNAIDVVALQRLAVTRRKTTVFIAALKNPGVGQELAQRLQTHGIRADVCREIVPRAEFLTRMANSRVAVCLPDPHEGFFLPPLEAMALGTLVVLPYCAGAQAFCINEETALCTDYNAPALAHATGRLLRDAALAHRMHAAATRKAQEHIPERERGAFIAALASYLPEDL